MPADKELVVYSRTTYCPYLDIAHRVFDKHRIRVREIMIDQDAEAEARVVAWTGFKSVPTIVIARIGENLPMAEPSPLPEGESPRGIDRGSMITEARQDELEMWLKKNGFIG